MVDGCVIKPNAVLTQGADTVGVGKQTAEGDRVELEKPVDDLGQWSGIVLDLLENLRKQAKFLL